MLHKRKRPRVKVRVIFSMPPLEGVTAVSLLGDFNDWSATATPLVREADGSWSAVLMLDAGRRYQFRYRDDRGEWHNDSAADAYAPNEFGSDNSVLDLTVEAAPAARNASPARARSGRPGPRPGSRKAKKS